MNFNQLWHSGIAWNLASVAVLAICGFGLNVLIALCYDTATLGVFNQVMAAYVIAGQLGAAGFHVSTLKAISGLSDRDDPTHRTIGVTSLGLSVLTSSVVTGVFYASRGLIAGWLKSPAVEVGLEWITPGLFLFCVNKNLMAIVNGRAEMRAFASFQSLRYVILLLGFGIALAFQFPGERLSYVFSLSEGVLFVCLSLYCRKSLRPSGAGGLYPWFERHYRFGIKSALSGTMLEVNSRVDILVLGYFLSDHEAGIYSFAAMIFEGVMQLLVVLQTNFNPKLSQMHHAGDLAGLSRFIHLEKRKTYRYGFLLAPLVIALYPVGLRLVSPAGELRASWLPFGVLMGSLALSAGYIPFHNLLAMSGRPGFQTLFMLGLVVANIVLNVLFVPVFGILGAALGTGAALVLGCVLLTWLSRRCLEVAI